MDNISKQSTFSRTIANESKMGAYYTDKEHCEWISKFFEFPSGEVCALEPAMGNAEGIELVTQKGLNTNVKLFGVELDRNAYDELNENKLIEKVLNTDFLNGVKISHNAFSFCFSNPPYGSDFSRGNQGRLEKSFLEKIINYLKTGGILVYVIPYAVFTEPSFFRIWCSYFETYHVYKFHKHEFDKWKQVVLIGRKKQLQGVKKDDLLTMLAKYADLDTISELPVDYQGEKIRVYESKASAIELFTTMEFNVELARERLHKSRLNSMLNSKYSIEKYSSAELNRPPIPLKRDLMHLLSVTGGGEGLAGNEEEGDLHLQRGTVKVVETETYETDELNQDKEYLKVRSASSVTVCVIENNGRITRLK